MPSSFRCLRILLPDRHLASLSCRGERRDRRHDRCYARRGESVQFRRRGPLMPLDVAACTVRLSQSDADAERRAQRVAAAAAPVRRHDQLKPVALAEMQLDGRESQPGADARSRGVPWSARTQRLAQVRTAPPSAVVRLPLERAASPQPVLRRRARVRRGVYVLLRTPQPALPRRQAPGLAQLRFRGDDGSRPPVRRRERASRAPNERGCARPGRHSTD